MIESRVIDQRIQNASWRVISEPQAASLIESWYSKGLGVREGLSFAEGVVLKKLREQREEIVDAWIAEMEVEEWQKWPRRPTDLQKKLICTVISDTIDEARDRQSPLIIGEKCLGELADVTRASDLKRAFGLSYRFSAERLAMAGKPYHPGGYSRDQVLKEIRAKFFYPQKNGLPYLMVLGEGCWSAGFVGADELSLELKVAQSSLYKYLANILGPRPLVYCPRLLKKDRKGGFVCKVIFPLVLIGKLREHFVPKEPSRLTVLPRMEKMIVKKSGILKEEMEIEGKSWMDLDEAIQKDLWANFQEAKKRLLSKDDLNDGNAQEIILEGLAARAIILSSLRVIVNKVVSHWQTDFREDLRQVGEVALFKAISRLPEGIRRGSYVYYYCQRWVNKAVNHAGWEMVREKRWPSLESWAAYRAKGQRSFRGKESPVEEEVYEQMLGAFFYQVLEETHGWTVSELAILNLRCGLYGNKKHTLQGTAQRLGISEAKVHQQEVSAFSKLRTELIARGLVLDDFVV